MNYSVQMVMEGDFPSGKEVSTYAVSEKVFDDICLILVKGIERGECNESFTV